MDAALKPTPVDPRELPLIEKLSLRFEPKEIEWRISSSGTKKSGDPWAHVVPYLQARAVQARLDWAVGPLVWKDEYKPIEGGFLCTIWIRSSDGEWIGKQDGAEFTNIEGTKGGLSDAFKRAAVKWGIGRYLYDLGGPFWAEISDSSRDGFHYAKTKHGKFYWQPDSRALDAIGMYSPKGCDPTHGEKDHQPRPKNAGERRQSKGTVHNAPKKVNVPPQNYAEKINALVANYRTIEELAEFPLVLSTSDYWFTGRDGMKLKHKTVKAWEQVVDWHTKHAPELLDEPDIFAGLVLIKEYLACHYANQEADQG